MRSSSRQIPVTQVFKFHQPVAKIAEARLQRETDFDDIAFAKSIWCESVCPLLQSIRDSDNLELVQSTKKLEQQQEGFWISDLTIHHNDYDTDLTFSIYLSRYDDKSCALLISPNTESVTFNATLTDRTTAFGDNNIYEHVVNTIYDLLESQLAFTTEQELDEIKPLESSDELNTSLDYANYIKIGETTVEIKKHPFSLRTTETSFQRLGSAELFSREKMELLQQQGFKSSP